MKTAAAFFPIDLFGSPGTSAGCRLLADAVREMLADTRRETVPARGRCYDGRVRVREFAFDTLDALTHWRRDGRRAVRDALRKGEFLIWASGNHLGALPVYDELTEADLVVQFDAHLDVYNLSDCTEELSHGNFLLHADRPLPKVVNVGHRDLFMPADHALGTFAHLVPADEAAADPAGAAARLRKLAADAGRVFVDIDCDVFDPAYFPAVTHPQPFGLSPAAVLRLVNALGVGRLAGVALSEFEPGRDDRDRSLATLVWLTEYLLLARYEGAAAAASGVAGAGNVN